MTTHDLKTWPEFFESVMGGEKTFELRLDDRGFRAGDKLRLLEWLPTEKRYTGREVIVDVPYLVCGPAFGLERGHVCMTIEMVVSETTESRQSLARRLSASQYLKRRYFDSMREMGKTHDWRVAGLLEANNGYLERARRAEAALASAVKIAGEAADEWDKAPEGMRAGKIIMALAGHVPGYRADTDAIHAAIKGKV